MTEHTFPVLLQENRTLEREIYAMGCPKSVPWDFIASHREQCHKNHDQSPERLAERGGLSPQEMIAVVTGQRMWDVVRLSYKVAIPELLRLIGEWKREQIDWERKETCPHCGTVYQPMVEEHEANNCIPVLQAKVARLEEELKKAKEELCAFATSAGAMP
jgi:hypothetical protein